MKKCWPRKRRGNKTPIADDDFSSTSVLMNKPETPSFEQFLPDADETVFMENQLYISSESIRSLTEDLKAHIKQFVHNQKIVRSDISVERRSLNIGPRNKDLYRNGQRIIPVNEIKSVHDSVEIRNTSIAGKSRASVSCMPHMYDEYKNDDNIVQVSGIEFHSAGASPRTISSMKTISYPNLQTDRKESFTLEKRSSAMWQRFKSKIDIFMISKQNRGRNENGGQKKDKKLPLNNEQKISKELFFRDKNANRNHKISSLECDKRKSITNKETQKENLVSEGENKVSTSECWEYEPYFSVEKENQNTTDDDEFLENVYDDPEEMMLENDEIFLPKERRSCFDEHETRNNSVYDHTKKKMIIGAKKLFFNSNSKNDVSHHWRNSLRNNGSSQEENRHNSDEDEFEDNPLYDNPEEIRNESQTSFLDPEINVHPHQHISTDDNLSPQKEDTYKFDEDEFEDNPLYDNPEEIRNESQTSFLNPEINVHPHRLISTDDNLSLQKENTYKFDKDEFEDNPLYDNPEEITIESQTSFLNPEINDNVQPHRFISPQNNLTPRNEDTCKFVDEEDDLYENPDHILF